MYVFDRGMCVRVSVCVIRTRVCMYINNIRVCVCMVFAYMFVCVSNLPVWCILFIIVSGMLLRLVLTLRV